MSDAISAPQAVSPSADPAAQVGLMSLLPPSCPQELSALSRAGQGLCRQPQLLPSALPQLPKAPPELWFGAVPAARGSCLCEERHRVQGAHGFSSSGQGLVPTPSPCPPGTFRLTATFPVLRSDPHGLFPWWGPCPSLALCLSQSCRRRSCRCPWLSRRDACSPCLVPVSHRWFGGQWVPGGSLGTRAKRVPSLPFVVCPQGDRVDTHRELERALQGEDGCLPGGVVNRLIAEASGDLRAPR